VNFTLHPAFALSSSCFLETRAPKRKSESKKYYQKGNKAQIKASKPVKGL
jgi:hypothetical protein